MTLCAFQRLHLAVILSVTTLVAASSASRDTFAQEIDGLATARALEQSFVTIIARAENSVVSIARIRKPSATAEPPRANAFGFGDRDGLPDSRNPNDPDFVPNDFGTGIVITHESDKSKRFILTNYHVVRDGPAATQPPVPTDVSLFVRFSDRRGYYARIVAADPRSDLAVLDIDFDQLGIGPDDLTPIPFGSADSIRRVQFVIALGNPYAIGRDGSSSASWGMISNIARRPAPARSATDPASRGRETMHHFGTLLQTDTRLSLGTSGGPLLNLNGELVGVTTSLAALDGYEKSVGYAIPIDRSMRRVIEALTDGYEVEYGFLGIHTGNVLPERMRELSGDFRQPSAVRVVDVIMNSPASSGGLLPNDVILKVEGAPVFDQYDLMRSVGQLSPGTYTRLRVWRERSRRELTLTVNLGKWPVHDEENIIATAQRYPSWRGLLVDYPTGRNKYLPYPKSYHDAVVITQIDTGTNATPDLPRVGEFISHVITTQGKIPIRTPAEFHRAVRGEDGDVTLQLLDERRIVIHK